MRPCRTVLLVYGALLVTQTAQAADRPNFVVIMADDLGASELGSYGHPKHQTPTLDRLAADGVRFQTCLATPVCSPTRVLLMTGRYGFRTGWCNFLERPFAPRPGTPQFDIGTSEVTFADVLKQKGYATGIAGKWQLPGSPSGRIRDCGFDTYCMWMWKHQVPDIDPATGEDRIPFDPLASLHKPKRTNRFWEPAIMQNGRRRKVASDAYGPDVYANFVCDFIRSKSRQPFLIYYPMVLTHMHGGTWPPTPDLDSPGHRTPAGLKYNVEYVDHLVGRILATLHKEGLDDNTYVIFTGDNGTAGDGKGHVTEKGTRVPLIVRGPGIPAGRVSDVPVDLSDILPTLSDLAGGELPGDRTVDGVSLVPELRDAPGQRRTWAFSYLKNQRLLRDSRWLLEGDGRFYDCGDSRNGQHYRDVSGSTEPVVVNARQRFAKILADLPNLPSIPPGT